MLFAVYGLFWERSRLVHPFDPYSVLLPGGDWWCSVHQRLVDLVVIFTGNVGVRCLGTAVGVHYLLDYGFVGRVLGWLRPLYVSLPMALRPYFDRTYGMLWTLPSRLETLLLVLCDHLSLLSLLLFVFFPLMRRHALAVIGIVIRVLLDPLLIFDCSLGRYTLLRRLHAYFPSLRDRGRFLFF